MLDSVKAIQTQMLYKVQPVSLDEKANNRSSKGQALNTGVNFFTGKNYTPNYPSVEGSPTLGRSLDLLG